MKDPLHLYYLQGEAAIFNLIVFRGKSRCNPPTPGCNFIRGISVPVSQRFIWKQKANKPSNTQKKLGTGMPERVFSKCFLFWTPEGHKMISFSSMCHWILNYQSQHYFRGLASLVQAPRQNRKAYSGEQTLKVTTKPNPARSNSQRGLWGSAHITSPLVSTGQDYAKHLPKANWAWKATDSTKTLQFGERCISQTVLWRALHAPCAK